MKYVSIDIETTGLNPETCQVLEIGAVIDDLSNYKPISDLPTFHAYILHDLYVGEPFALSMHSEIFKRLSNQSDEFDYFEPIEIADAFSQFLDKNEMHERVVAAGKNFASFDAQFLKRLPDWYVDFHHRTIDPGMLYWDMVEDDNIPNLKTCKERAGIEGEVLHTALEDAMDVVKLIRNKRWGKI